MVDEPPTLSSPSCDRRIHLRKLIVAVTLIAALVWAATALGGGPKVSWITTCSVSHMSMDDPIVFPGQPGLSHHHTFAGATTTDAFSTFDSLLAGGTTCGMPADHSAYWVPTANYSIHPKLGTLWYYSASQSSPVFPNGLKMIVRWSGGHVHFKCGPSANTLTLAPPASCSSGMLVAVVEFPRYWDGAQVDSADHLSHMSYTRDAAHPIELPMIKGFVRYAVPAGKPIDLQLSSGDYTSWHVDFFEGWIPSELQRFITQCGGKECGQNPS
jgi:hypothetical protein